MTMTSPVQSRDHEDSQWEEEKLTWVLSLEWKSEGVMDDKNGDDDRDGLRSEKDESWTTVEIIN